VGPAAAVDPGERPPRILSPSSVLHFPAAQCYVATTEPVTGASADGGEGSRRRRDSHDEAEVAKARSARSRPDSAWRAERDWSTLNSWRLRLRMGSIE